METVSPSLDLLHVEADAMQAKAELLRHVANEIHFVAGMLRYKAYDFDSDSARLRKVIWETANSKGADGILLNYTNDDEEQKVLRTLSSGNQMTEAAEQIMIWFKMLLNASCSDGQPQPGATAMEWRKKEVQVKYEKTSSEKVGLARLPDMICEKLTPGASVYADNKQSVFGNTRPEPHNPILGQTDHNKFARPLPFSPEDIALRPKETKRGIRGGKQGWDELGCDTYTNSNDNANPRDMEINLPRSEQEKDQLAWIPAKVDVRRMSLPAEKGLQSLMMGETERVRGERTY